MKNQQLQTITKMATGLKEGNMTAVAYNEAIAKAVTAYTGKKVSAMAYALIKEEDVVFNVGATIQLFLDGKVPADKLGLGLYETYELVAEGKAVMISEADAVRHESAAEIKKLQDELTKVQSAQAVNTTTNKEETNMDNTVKNEVQPMPNKQSILATYAEGNMTLEQMTVLLSAIDGEAQQQTPQQAQVKQKGAVGQLLQGFVGVGTQAVNTVTGAVQGAQIKEKATNIMDGALDKGHALVGATVNTGVAVGLQALTTTSSLTQSAITVTAGIATQLVKATEEIGSLVIKETGNALRVVNDQVYYTGKGLINTEPVTDDAGRSVEEILASFAQYGQEEQNA